jgi:hypothetical protein
MQNVNPVFDPHDDNEYGIPSHESHITQARWDAAWVDNEKMRALSREEFAALLRQNAHLLKPTINTHRVNDKLAKYARLLEENEDTTQNEADGPVEHSVMCLDIPFLTQQVTCYLIEYIDEYTEDRKPMPNWIEGILKRKNFY